jgi:hypothetical protein
MDKEYFEILRKRYAPMIEKIINSNVDFYRTNQTIQWNFGYDKRCEIFGACDRKTNVITLNIESVHSAIQQNEPLQIEYFLLHEIRHIYQRLEIEDFKQNPTKCNNADLARKWLEEETNYTTALNQNNEENAEYFQQDLELDAYAYALAVMKYKYGDVPYLYIPQAYETNGEFSEIVESWLRVFKEENL